MSTGTMHHHRVTDQPCVLGARRSCLLQMQAAGLESLTVTGSLNAGGVSLCIHPLCMTHLVVRCADNVSSCYIADTCPLDATAVR